MIPVTHGALFRIPHLPLALIAGALGVLDNVLMNPEPSSVALFALGALGFGGFAWRRRAAAKKPTA